MNETMVKNDKPTHSKKLRFRMMLDLEKDITLYLDIAKTFRDTRDFVRKKFGQKEHLKLLNIHIELLERLAKRLKIQTIIESGVDKIE